MLRVLRSEWIMCHSLLQLNEVKYLGMDLERRLTWKEHITTTRRKLNFRFSKACWLLGRRSHLTTENKLLLYTARKSKTVPLHAMQALGGEEVWLLLIHDLGTRWGWVVSVTPQPRFTPGERTPGTHWTGGWMGPRAGLDTEARGKFICPCRGSNPGRPARSQTLYWLSYPGSCTQLYWRQFGPTELRYGEKRSIQSERKYSGSSPRY
jgi:hypothetical protein